MSPIVPLLRTFDYAGRARRLELWPFAATAAMLVAEALLWDAAAGRARAVAGFAGPLTVIAGLLLALPLAPLLVRRLHDTGRGAAWLALLLLPIVGWAWLCGLLAIEGDAGANRFGANPKAATRRPPLAGLFAG